MSNSRVSKHRVRTAPDSLVSTNQKQQQSFIENPVDPVIVARAVLVQMPMSPLAKSPNESAPSLR